MTRNELDPEPDEHVITSVEAHWYKSRHEWNEEGAVNTEQVSLRQETPVENSQWKWEYWCKCGAEFDNWDEAHDHLQEVNTPNNKTNNESS